VTREGTLEIAESATAWDRLSWWELEARLFREHPRIRSVLSTMSPVSARKFFARGRVRPLQPVVALMQLAGPVLPAVALVLLASSHLPRPDGVRFLPAVIVVAIAVVLVILNVRDREEVEPGPAFLIGWCHLVPSAILLIFSMQAIATGRSADAAPWMAVVFALDVIVGVLYLVLTPRPKDPVAARAERARARWRNAMASLTPTQESELRDELAETLDLLAERGLIDAATAHRARQAPLGLLGATLAPEPSSAR
jgi:hypothetical protein